jgi:hypothetical protein
MVTEEGLSAVDIDPIDVIRSIRENHARRHGFDLSRVIPDLQRFAKKNTIMTVKLRPKKVAPRPRKAS